MSRVGFDRDGVAGRTPPSWPGIGPESELAMTDDVLARAKEARTILGGAMPWLPSLLTDLITLAEEQAAEIETAELIFGEVTVANAKFAAITDRQAKQLAAIREVAKNEPDPQEVRWAVLKIFDGPDTFDGTEL